MSVKTRISEDGVVMFWCPGCEAYHGVWTKVKNSRGAIWQWNGNLEKPTFKPSILVHPVEYKGGHTPLCHSFITDGNIRFLDDCTHHLKGQTVPIPDEPE